MAAARQVRDYSPPCIFSFCYYTGSEKLGILDISYGICLCLDERSVWRRQLRTEKKCMHSRLSATLLWSTQFFRINWSQVEVPCSGWEQGRSHCWCVIFSVDSLGTCVPAQGWDSLASGRYLSSPLSWRKWCLRSLDHGTCSWERFKAEGKSFVGGEANLCEPCKTCMYLITNLSTHRLMEAWGQNMRNALQVLCFNQDHSLKLSSLQNDSSQGHAKDMWNCMEINPNCHLWQVV